MVKGIPRGTTLSYGEVALRAGKPGGARAVVSALRTLDVAWWRVARHDGSLAPQVAALQATLLRQEGWKGKEARARAHREGARTRRGGTQPKRAAAEGARKRDRARAPRR